MRPEPKIHDETATSPPLPKHFDDRPLKFKEPSTILQALVKLELSRYGLRYGGWRKFPSPYLKTWHVISLIGLLCLILGVLIVHPPSGLILLTAFCFLIILPWKKIGAFVVRHRIACGILCSLLLAAVAICNIFFPQRIDSMIRSIFSHDAFLQMPLGGPADSPFYYVREFPMPFTEGIVSVSPVPTHAVCEELLRGKAGSVKWREGSSEKCVANSGQYAGFFHYKPGPDWYAIFQAPGRAVNLGIIRLRRGMGEPGKEDALHPVRLFVEGQRTAADLESPPVPITVRIISPEGEVDPDSWELKK